MTSDKTIVRVHHGLSIDSFGVETDAKDAALRRDLCLSDKPYVMIGADPAREDTAAGSFLRCSMAHLLGERAKTYASAPDRVSYHYQCTAACSATFSLYGYVTNLLVCNSYRLQWSAARRFIEEEENVFRSAWESAQPRPWGWFPEAFVKTPNARWLEAPELRLEAIAAMSFGAKAVSYYTFGSAEDWSGFEKSLLLLAEIKRLNADFKKLEPWLASALPISQETVGSTRKGLRVSRLWSGDGDALVVVVRNLDYETDRDDNDFGRKPRFKAKPKENVQISLRRPGWLNPTKAVDALTGQAVSCGVENQSIRLDLGAVELGKIVVIQ